MIGTCALTPIVFGMFLLRLTPELDKLRDCKTFRYPNDVTDTTRLSEDTHYSRSLIIVGYKYRVYLAVFVGYTFGRIVGATSTREPEKEGRRCYM